MHVHQVDCGALIRCFCGCWERFPFLFFVLTAHRSSALDLALPLRVGRWRASVFSLRQDGVKGAADSGPPAHSGRGLGDGGRRGTACGAGLRRQRQRDVAAEAGVTLHQPEARRALSRGSCPWIPGTWQWRAAQAPRKRGVESDLCSHTGPLVAAAAALASPASPWGPCF